MYKGLLTAIFFLFSAHLLYAQTYTPAEAAKHIGQKATVCGKIYSGHFSSNIKSQPTFLDMGRAYPNQLFTIMIRGENRKKFSYKPEKYLLNKNVCITGEIKSFRHQSEIIVSDTAQVKINDSSK